MLLEVTEQIIQLMHHICRPESFCWNTNGGGGAGIGYETYSEMLIDNNQNGTSKIVVSNEIYGGIGGHIEPSGGRG